MADPYRTAQEPDIDVEVEETPEAIVFDTLKRLRSLDIEEAQHAVRSIAAFMGFDVGRRGREGYWTVDSDEAGDDE
jgi:hypothetical protein